MSRDGLFIFNSSKNVTAVLYELSLFKKNNSCLLWYLSKSLLVCFYDFSTNLDYADSLLVQFLLSIMLDFTCTNQWQYVLSAYMFIGSYLYEFSGSLSGFRMFVNLIAGYVLFATQGMPSYFTYFRRSNVVNSKYWKRWWCQRKCNS